MRSSTTLTELWTPEGEKVSTLPLGRAAFDVDQALWDEHGGAFTDEMAALVPEVLTWTISALAASARSLGRGAGMLFLPDGARVENTKILADAPAMEPSNERHSPWNNGLLDYLQYEALLRFADKGKLVEGGLKTRYREDLQKWCEEVLSIDRDDAAAQWRSDVDRYVRLSQRYAVGWLTPAASASLPDEILTAPTRSEARTSCSLLRPLGPFTLAPAS